MPRDPPKVRPSMASNSGQVAAGSRPHGRTVISRSSGRCSSISHTVGEWGEGLAVIAWRLTGGRRIDRKVHALTLLANQASTSLRRNRVVLGRRRNGWGKDWSARAQRHTEATWRRLTHAGRSGQQAVEETEAEFKALEAELGPWTAQSNEFLATLRAEIEGARQVGRDAKELSKSAQMLVTSALRSALRDELFSRPPRRSF